MELWIKCKNSCCGLGGKTNGLQQLRELHEDIPIGGVFRRVPQTVKPGFDDLFFPKSPDHAVMEKVVTLSLCSLVHRCKKRKEGQVAKQRGDIAQGYTKKKEKTKKIRLIFNKQCYFCVTQELHKPC